VVQHWTRNREVAASTHTRSTARNLEQVANILCAQANSASYPQRDGKWVVPTATGWRPWLMVSASCIVAWVQLSVSACNRCMATLRHHWLMPISCHFRDRKALLVTSLTHVSGAICKWKAGPSSSNWASISHRSGLTSASLKGLSLDHCCLQSTAVRWLMSSPAMEYSTTDTQMIRSSVSPYTPTTHPTGCPFSPRVYCWRQAMVHAERTAAKPGQVGSTDRRHCESAARRYFCRDVGICGWRRSVGGQRLEGSRCRAWPSSDIPKTRHGGIARSCNYHSQAIRHIRHLLSTELAATLACSLIPNRLDYCNSVLYGAPASSIQVLQRVQNNAARIVLQAPRRSHAKPLLRELH